MMKYRIKQFFRHHGALLLAMIVGCCGGCWEEIRYEPQSQATITSQPSTLPASLLPPASSASQPPALPGGISETQAPAEQEQASATSEASTAIEPLQSNSQQNNSNDGYPPAKPGAEVAAVTESREKSLPANDTSGDLLFEEFFSSEMPPTDSLPLPNTKLNAWQLGSYWSLGTAYYAKDASVESYQSRLELAGSAAEKLQIKLPALPDVVSTGDRVAAMVAYLLDDRGPLLTEQMGQQFDTQHAALVQLAVRSHVLLLVYSPRSKKIESLVEQVEQSASASGLPENLWTNLVDLLQQRAPYLDVKPSVFTLHEKVEAHLSAQKTE